jgi:Leucine-rich repeat (LRR) protein
LQVADSPCFCVDRSGDITHLSLSGNPIIDVPPVLSSLENLRVLRLYRCALEIIPEPIYDLRTLEALYLSGNKISTLPVDLSKLSHLRILALNDNGIRTLPASMQALSQVHTLGLQSNDLEDISTVALLPHLARLYVGKNPLHVIPIIPCSSG